MIHSDDPGTARLVELRDVEARGAATERAVERGLADRVTAGEPRAREVRDAPKNGLVLGDIGHLANAAEPATRDLDSCHARDRHDARDRRGTGKSRQTQVPVHGSAGTRPSLTEPAAGKSGGERDGRLERPRSG